eukprot:COSAG01_NODE_13711_length_1545_cov_1.656985_2_plen_211_part_00
MEQPTPLSSGSNIVRLGSVFRPKLSNFIGFVGFSLCCLVFTAIYWGDSGTCKFRLSCHSWAIGSLVFGLLGLAVTPTLALNKLEIGQSGVTFHGAPFRGGRGGPFSWHEIATIATVQVPQGKGFKDAVGLVLTQAVSSDRKPILAGRPTWAQCDVIMVPMLTGWNYCGLNMEQFVQQFQQLLQQQQQGGVPSTGAAPVATGYVPPTLTTP